MLVYRITTKKWSKNLAASGYSARWNSKGNFVLYTSSSPALATLENLVHMNQIKIAGKFDLMTIEINDNLVIDQLEHEDLPKQWFKTFPESIRNCKTFGDNWYLKFEKAVLKVPSAITLTDYNYLINTKHPDFKKNVKLKSVKDFNFDNRL